MLASGVEIAGVGQRVCERHSRVVAALDFASVAALDAAQEPQLVLRPPCQRKGFDVPERRRTDVVLVEVVTLRRIELRAVLAGELVAVVTKVVVTGGYEDADIGPERGGGGG